MIPSDDIRSSPIVTELDFQTVRFSELERTKRIDAEFFHKRHILTAQLLKKCRTQSVVECAGVSDGNHFAISEQFVEEGIAYYRGQDVVGHFFVEQSKPIHITEAAFREPFMVRSHLQKGDVLLSIVGTIGDLSIVSENTLATCSCKLAILRPKSVAPEYLATFLRCAYGRSQIERLTRGAVQMGILLEDMDQLMVVRLSTALERMVVRLVEEAKACVERSKTEFQTAETSLLTALGLMNWQPPEPLTYTQKASKVFAAGRADAEFFAPRVGDLLARLNQNGLTVGDVAPPRHEQFVPSDKGHFEYIEIGGLNGEGWANTETVPMEEAPSRATWRVHKADVITSTVRPIRRLSAIITPEQDGAVASSGFVVLQPLKVSPEVLLTFLRLTPVCEFMDLHTSASMYPAISERDLLNLPFRRIDGAAETVVVRAVGASRVGREQARRLLQKATRAVEIAIEQSEADALAFLSEKGN